MLQLIKSIKYLSLVVLPFMSMANTDTIPPFLETEGSIKISGSSGASEPVYILNHQDDIKGYVHGKWYSLTNPGPFEIVDTTQFSKPNVGSIPKHLLNSNSCTGEDTLLIGIHTGLYDSGGEFGEYQNGEDYCTCIALYDTINSKPWTGFTQFIVSYSTELSFDSLYIELLPITFGDSLIRFGFSGLGQDTLVLNLYNRLLKIRFKSDGSNVGSGFEIIASQSTWNPSSSGTSEPLASKDSLTPQAGWYVDPIKFALRGGTALGKDWALNSGKFSIAHGTNNEASGSFSAAFGVSNRATGLGAVAWGSGALAQGDFSRALGEGAVASKLHSTAIGPTQSVHQSCVTVGQFNESNPALFISSDPLFIVGNGAHSSNRSNAIVVNYSGNVGIGVNDPSVALDVNGNIQCTGSHCTSDLRFKKDIRPINNSLERVLKLRGVNYIWKKSPYHNFSNKLQMGLIAQEVEAIFPELVATDKKGMKSMDYQSMVAVLVESIKEQQEMIDQLQNQLSRQQLSIDELKLLRKP